MKRILRMRVENFLSFREADFDFADAGFVLVEGKNGAGKSAMIDAVVWCLSGTTLRGYEKDEVVNRRAEEGCVVAVDLEDGDDSYRVVRARRHKKLKNSLCLYRDGVDVTSRDANETQLAVERVLGCTLKTFLTSVVFGQDRAYRFSSLTDGEQKKILDEVLGVERFAQGCAAARKQVSIFELQLESARQGLEKAEKARGEAEAEAVDLQAMHVDFESNQRKKVEVEREKLRIAKEHLDKARKVANVPALKTAVDAALKALTVAEKLSEKCILASADAAGALSNNKHALDGMLAAMKKEPRGSGNCPTCGQKVDPKGGAITLLQGEVRDKISKLKKENVTLVEMADEAVVALASSKTRLKMARQAMTDAQKALNDGVAADADAATWRRRHVDHESRITELEAEISPYAELAEKATARHARYDLLFKQHEHDVAEFGGHLRRAEFWVKAFGTSGLRSLLVDSSLPLLNEEAARVSRVLTGGAVAIEFSATTEQKSGKVVDRFEVKVDNRHGAGDYAGNSSGERAKVDLCVGLALQRLVASRSSASFNVIFYDEIFDHLDSTAHEQVIEVLSDLDKESVFVVSHDDDLKAWFPATLRIVKHGGYSVVES